MIGAARGARRRQPGFGNAKWRLGLLSTLCAASVTAQGQADPDAVGTSAPGKTVPAQAPLAPAQALPAPAQALPAPAQALPAPAQALPAPAQALPAPAQALPNRVEPTASYHIKAKLDAATHRIQGHARIRFVNRSSRALDELWFHLYLNAFEHDRSLFLRSPWGASRSRLAVSEYGFIEVRRLQAPELSASDLWAQAAPHSPEDPEDRTDIRVPLPAPLDPGASLVLEVDFEAQLPRIVERTGFVDSFHFVAQWFPKLAKLEPDGHFAHFAFHPNAEFYADFGDYQVELDVPKGFIVGSSGQCPAPRVEGERQHFNCSAQSVHDFAWTAWDGFQLREESIGPVQVRLLFPPGHERLAEITLGALRSGLPAFNERYGAYPWPTLTVVDPPESAPSAGGMEYPTLITTGGNWIDAWVGHEVETVVVHELAHQWFYGLVASNEFAWPVLDEGLTTYAESTLMGDLWGPASATQWFGWTVSSESLRRAYQMGRAQESPIAARADSFQSFSSLGALVYARTGTLFETLSHVYGKERVADFVGRYARRYRFQHPAPEDLLRVAEEVMGPRARATLQTALFERGWVNYRAEGLECVSATEPGGSHATPGGREFRLRTVIHPPVHACRALLVREGTLQFPVQVDLVDDQGKRTREIWDDPRTWRHVVHEGPRPIVAVVVDPDRRVTIDSNLLDNAVSQAPRPPRATESLLTYLAELALRWIGP